MLGVALRRVLARLFYTMFADRLQRFINRVQNLLHNSCRLGFIDPMPLALSLMP